MSEFETRLRELSKEDVGLAIKHLIEVLNPDQPHFSGEGDVFVFCSAPNKETNMSEMLEESEFMLKKARQMYEDEIDTLEEEE